MDIKVILTSENMKCKTTVTPMLLLNMCEEDLVEQCVCGSCENYRKSYENGEPYCYGECIETVYDSGYELGFE